jgi:outer membrane protein assembly factor BamB
MSGIEAAMMQQQFSLKSICLLLSCAFISARHTATAEDRAQWGERNSRNMVSDEKGLPDSFDVTTGQNVKWSVEIGSECYATPVVAQGKVFIGTNNEQPRDPKHQGDRGVMMCFNEADGKFLWQLVVPKLENDIYLDWPRAGMCSSVTVEGDRVYVATNRDEVVCLDIDGMTDGNDGPYQDEGRHMSPGDQPPLEAGPLDADIIWLQDLRKEAGVRPHDSVHASVLIDGPYLYLNTNNGLNSKHDGVEKPEAPALVVLDKATGKLLARENEGISRGTFHSNWSAPGLADIQGKRLILFGGGNGVCYAFESYKAPETPSQELASLKTAWRFDCDPTAPKENIHTYIRNRQVSPSNIKSTAVYHDGDLFVTVGGDLWWGKNEAWLQCIDARRTGDITGTGLKWKYPLDHHCLSTPSVRDGLVYVADCGGKVHCVDAATGKPFWIHDAGGEMWASTLVADGKIYVGTRRGKFWVLAADRTKRVIASFQLESPVVSTCVAANGTLFVGTMTHLHAVKAGGGSQ